MTGTQFRLEVRPNIPQRLVRLSELANDLLYSWDRQVRSLFARLDWDLWNECGHNPKLFLRRVAQDTLQEAAEDKIFMEDYNRVLSAYDTYHGERQTIHFDGSLDPKTDMVAYFCAEFGFHESVPIYSGGLGILAGDHCKAASDTGIPFTGIGLLYRQGYFTQTIDGRGHQIAHYKPTNFADLPIELAHDAGGREIVVQLEFLPRPVSLRVWKMKTGHITVYLLDSDLSINHEKDREITYQLYGGDIHMRIQQEIVLGIGGVRALRALNITPTVWHINEGHSAFQILERCAELCRQNIEFDTALEYVAACTVFTTHTPVSAGHDIFDHSVIGQYLDKYCQNTGVAWDRLLQLGRSPAYEHGFNMTALALRGSRYHNGVSRIHGRVASQMESYIWPQIPADENPIGYVTNGVHLPTFLAWEWANLFYRRLGGGWRNELCNASFWDCIDQIPDHSYWSVHQSLKAVMLDEVYRRAVQQHRRNGWSQAQIERLTQHICSHDMDFLVLGFARRFATYKRAGLIFSDPQRLATLLNNPKKPVILIFSGKAHPNDEPGQALIRLIHSFAHKPEFEGKIILLEGYDLALARKLVMGVDVWLNTPAYPLEASGTSGQKAGINGVINLSVLDGWWGEGYDAELENGWAITPHEPHFDPNYRDREESQDLLDIIEHQIIPAYYDRNGYGYSEKWVKKSKASMKSIIPRFNAQRMLLDYVKHYYGPASAKHHALSEKQYAPARELAQWKRKIYKYWDKVKIRRVDNAPEEIASGYALPLQVAVNLDELDHSDVIVECLIGKMDERGEFYSHSCHRLQPAGKNEINETVFNVDLLPTLPGLQYYKLRVFPHHRLSSHRFETGRMIWL